MEHPNMGDKKPPEYKPPEQEPPIPNAKQEPEDIALQQAKASPKHEGNKPPPAADPRKGGHPHPGWAAGYPPQHSEGQGGGYYYGGGGGGGYGGGGYVYGYGGYPPPAQGLVYPPPPYQGGGHGGVSGGVYSGGYMGWPAPAPPAGAYPAYGGSYPFGSRTAGYGEYSQMRDKQWRAYSEQVYGRKAAENHEPGRVYYPAVRGKQGLGHRYNNYQAFQSQDEVDLAGGDARAGKYQINK